jgi:hypothetical protein
VLVTISYDRGCNELKKESRILQGLTGVQRQQFDRLYNRGRVFLEKLMVA